MKPEPKRSSHLYTIPGIVFCMRLSASMLEAAEGGNSRMYKAQAELLRAAADDLEGGDQR